MSQSCHEVELRLTMIDPGFSLNIMPPSTLEAMNPSRQSCREGQVSEVMHHTLDFLNINLIIETIPTTTRFHVDARTSYLLVLRRT